MKKKNKKIVVTKLKYLFVGLFLIFAALSGYLSWRVWEDNRVVAVPDGDSIDLSDGQRVRLLALDAPERGRCMADQAREGLTKLVLGRHVRLKNTVKDSYGRTLAIVIIEEPRAWVQYLRWWFSTRVFSSFKTRISNLDVHSFPESRTSNLESRLFPNPDPLVNRVMIARGLARYESVSNPYHDTLSQASQEAKDGKLGIYSPLCRSLSSGTSCTVKGNIRDGKKTYHYPGCDNYDQVIVDLSYGDAWFCSQKEAIAAGFTKASGCR